MVKICHSYSLMCNAHWYCWPTLEVAASNNHPAASLFPVTLCLSTLQLELCYDSRWQLTRHLSDHIVFYTSGIFLWSIIYKFLNVWARGDVTLCVWDSNQHYQTLKLNRICLLFQGKKLHIREKDIRFLSELYDFQNKAFPAPACYMTDKMRL